MSSQALSESLEATHLNVEVDDPKLYHGNCVDVIADGTIELLLNDPPYGVGLSTRSRVLPTPSKEWAMYYNSCEKDSNAPSSA